MKKIHTTAVAFRYERFMISLTTFSEILEQKKHLLGEFGFDPTYIPDMAFDFQREIITRACKKGRMAVFADTGLGKTLIQLSLAKNVIEHTNKKVLILTPLAVAPIA